MANVDEIRGRVADRIRATRKNKRITQPQLSEALAVEGIFISPSAIAKIENNKRGLEVAEAAAIAKILGLRLDQLVKSDFEDDDNMGELLQEQSFTAAMLLVGHMQEIAEGIADYMDIVSEKVKLPKGTTHKVSLNDAQLSQAKAEEAIKSLNSLALDLRETFFYGGTFNEGVLDPDATGYGGTWEIPSLEKLLDLENGEG